MQQSSPKQEAGLVIHPLAQETRRNSLRRTPSLGLGAYVQALRQSVRLVPVETGGFHLASHGTEELDAQPSAIPRRSGFKRTWSLRQRGSRGSLIDRWQSAIAMIDSHVERGLTLGPPPLGIPTQTCAQTGFWNRGVQPPHGRTVQQPVQLT